MRQALKQRTSWLNRFALLNTVWAYLIGLHYFSRMDAHVTLNDGVFVLLSYLGQLGILSFLSVFVLGLLLILIIPWRVLSLTLVVVLAIVFQLTLFIDTIVYHLYHFHLNGVILRMLFSPAATDIFQLSQLEWLLALSACLLMILWQWFTARFIWRRLQRAGSKPLRLKWLWLPVVLALLASHAMHAWADATSNSAILQAAARLPSYFGLTARRRLLSWGLVSRKDLASVPNLQRAGGGDFCYPKQPLRFTKVAHKKNVVIIAIDAWRFDMLNQAVTPHITRFSKRASVFEQHYSGGNCTKAGIYSLFYSIPSSYWDDSSKGSVLIGAFKQAGYRFSILPSASLVQPPFYRNVFKAIRPLQMRTKGVEAWQKDKKITEQALAFLGKQKQSKQPFFMFMFYDAAHAYSFPQKAKQPFKPWWHSIDRLLLNNKFNPTPYFNRYKNALYYVDGLVGQVLASLKKNQLLDDTVVLITSDHGQEFNDNHRNYWGHSSNFTHFQIQVPLVWYEAGKVPQRYHHRTSHFDLAPTLLKNVLGVTNPITDYSVGKMLSLKKDWPFLAEGSYVLSGIVDPAQIITQYPGGFYRVTDWHAQPIKHPKLNTTEIQQAFSQMHHYYCS